MIWLPVAIAVLWSIAYFRPAAWVGRLAVVALAVWHSILYGIAPSTVVIWALLVLFYIPFIRRELISRPLLRSMRKALPRISQTEREALGAGNVWWDAELFSGKPNWDRLHALPAPLFSSEERAFLDGPVEELMRMIDDWNITHTHHDLPPEIWAFLKSYGFFGMIIPKRYGGLGFSALAHSQVVMKIASRSITASSTVMVPNSLGPAKLLLEYGTEAQKQHYLPRLASGDEIPCFALTAPDAGSDAAGISDVGIVCQAEFQGRPNVLGIRLTFNKRYITLGPIATLIGLAFKLRDPDLMLGNQRDIGITVALIPGDTPGIRRGRRHFPLNLSFQNGPIRGDGVFIPVEWIIGGAERAGQGWRMLMESLADGRGISLPAQSTGSGKLTSRITGAYARVRRQFNLPIGYFEGVEEPLARIAGNTYLMDSARLLTLAALDRGEKPSVITAIVKYELTERMRKVVNDAMDIQGGSGICMGPSNYLGRAYQGLPVAITVEGANILTRCLIIFGQGAIRAHPYLQAEIDAAQMPNHTTATVKFDRLWRQHAAYLLSNFGRALWLGITNARLVRRTPGDKHSRRYYRALTRLSAGFALTADIALLTLRGALKRRERLSGRFADVLSNLYLCSAVLKHFNDEGRHEEDLPLLHWACRTTIYRAQQSLLGVFWNLPIGVLAALLRAMLFPFGKPYSPPNDRHIHEVARLILDDTASRARLTRGIYWSDDARDPAGRIERAFHAVLKAEEPYSRVQDAIKAGKLDAELDGEALLSQAMVAGILDEGEAHLIRKADALTRDAVRVDEFSMDFSQVIVPTDHDIDGADGDGRAH
jgi:acyl-CoA dehydrogenase